MKLALGGTALKIARQPSWSTTELERCMINIRSSLNWDFEVGLPMAVTRRSKDYGEQSPVARSSLSNGRSYSGLQQSALPIRMQSWVLAHLWLAESAVYLWSDMYVGCHMRLCARLQQGHLFDK